MVPETFSENGQNLATWYYQISTEKACKDIHADMVATLRDDAPALSTVKKWAAEKRGRESLENDPRSGHPESATTQKISTIFTTW